MELGNERGNGETRQLDIFVGEFKPFVEINRPPAGDVIGDFDVSHLTAPEILGKNIVSVDETILRLAWLRVY